MRKHDVRKWLHAVLDLLPVILIPVFMIYSHRHTLTERTEVEINYKYESNEVNTLDDLVEGNIYLCENFYFVTSDLSNEELDIKIISYSNVNVSSAYSIDEMYFDDNYFNNNYNYINITYSNGDTFIYFTNEKAYIDVSFNGELDFTNCIFYCDNMTLNDFKSYLNLSGSSLPQYTDYNVIESVSVNDTNKDIMTVFMDDFNGAIDKYFNMGNVFNLNGVYQWFNTNIFSGNVPTVIYSIWNIALYELVMDLLFLLYGLFMWFIDMIQKLMEKPLDSVK